MSDPSDPSIHPERADAAEPAPAPASPGPVDEPAGEAEAVASFDPDDETADEAEAVTAAEWLGPDADDAGHLEVDLAAFLPEGSTLLGRDDDPDSLEPHGDVAVDESGTDESEPDEPADASTAHREPGGEAPIASEPVDADLSAAAPAVDAPEAEAPVAEPPVDLVALQAIEDDLTAVEAALAALDDGSYGSCAVCAAAIDADALAADPVRRTCAAHTVAAAR